MQEFAFFGVLVAAFFGVGIGSGILSMLLSWLSDDEESMPWLGWIICVFIASLAIATIYAKTMFV